MDNISVTGIVVSGCRKFRKQIYLPEDLINAHEAWMPSFVQGTLNVQLSMSDLPRPLRSAGLPALDLSDSFRPAIYRAGTDVPNNTIQPNAENPRRGDLQLWRAILHNHSTQTKHNCFMIRRVGSGYKNIAEILGQQNFRDVNKFKDGDQVSIQVMPGAGET